MSPINKYLHHILILLIFISVTASAYLFSTPKNNTNSPITTTTPKTSTKIQTEELIPAVLKQSDSKSPETNNKSAEQKQTPPPTTSITVATPTTTETIPIKFKIEDKEYEINIKPNISAYEAMNTLRESGRISFSTKNFSGLGQFVEEINGIKNSPNTGFYWTFYINNQEAKVGISNYIIKPNDLITWKYMKK